MRGIKNVFLFSVCLNFFISATSVLAEPQADAAQTNKAAQAQDVVEALNEPLYNPFVERYVLDEIKQLRVELAAQRIEFTKELVGRELSAVDKALGYSNTTVTYFFYLIAAVSSVLVLIGWTSIRDLKEKMQGHADEEVSKLIATYERRLRSIETQLTKKTQHIDENRLEIERTQEIHALWLRAGQESHLQSKVVLYDEILNLRPTDAEALTYKADAVLDMGEPQWAINLCRQALAEEPKYGHALYQLACANVMLENFDEAIKYLREALEQAESYRDEMANDPMLEPLHSSPEYRALVDHN